MDLFVTVLGNTVTLRNWCICSGKFVHSRFFSMNNKKKNVIKLGVEQVRFR